MSNTSFQILDKAEFQARAAEIFEILHGNMSIIAPTGNSYEEDFKLWSECMPQNLENPNRNIVLIFDGEALAGFFMFTIRDRTLVMDEIQFRAQYRGTGLFAKLYNYLFGILPDSLEFVEAYANKKNTKSQGILGHLGLENLGESKNGNSYRFRGSYPAMKNFFLKAQAANHYDKLIDENNDPVHDPAPLKAYMDKWDGQDFIACMGLDRSQRVLEIGVGTGRLAVRTAPLSAEFWGIDISPKTIDRAAENLAGVRNTRLVCGDFMEWEFADRFHVIYSSLTFMHIAQKQAAIDKIAGLLHPGGRFVLSIDKNQSDFIDTGDRKIRIYPDSQADTAGYIENAGLKITNQYETEFAAIFVAVKE